MKVNLVSLKRQIILVRFDYSITVLHSLTCNFTDERIELNNEYENWHRAKMELEQALINLTGLPQIALIGLGFPRRTRSYIL